MGLSFLEVQGPWTYHLGVGLARCHKRLAGCSPVGVNAPAGLFDYAGSVYHLDIQSTKLLKMYI